MRITSPQTRAASAGSIRPAAVTALPDSGHGVRLTAPRTAVGACGLRVHPARQPTGRCQRQGHWIRLRPRARRASWRPGRIVRPRSGPSVPPPPTAPMPKTSERGLRRPAECFGETGWSLVGSIRPATADSADAERVRASASLRAKCGECLGGLAADACGLGRVHPARHLRQPLPRTAGWHPSHGRCFGERLGGLTANLSGLVGSIRPATAARACARLHRAVASVSCSSRVASTFAASPA